MVPTTTTRTAAAAAAAVAAAAASWKLRLPVSFSHHSLFAILVVCLTSGAVATAQLHPSYNDRIKTVAQMLQQAARERAASHSLSGSGGLSPGVPMNESVEQTLRMDLQLLQGALVEYLEEESLSWQGLAGSNMSSSGLDGIGASCRMNLADLSTALEEKQLWALQVIDAMGKPPPAVSEGNLVWPGSYDMCRSIRSNVSLPTHPNFSGRYCTAFGSTTFEEIPAYFALGVCVPDSCAESDLILLLNDVLDIMESELLVSVDCPPLSHPLDTKATVAIVVCSLLLLLMVLGTLADVITQFGDQWFKPEDYQSLTGHFEQPGTTLKVLIAFSVYTNGKKLLSTHQSEGSITCVHGIRFLSISWVVLGHTFFTAAVYSGENTLPYFFQSCQRWTFQVIFNALVSVDTFFTMSGLLVAYLTLNELVRQKGKLNWFMFYFHRVWRLTPAYLLVIMVFVCLSPYWAEGPLASHDTDRHNCQNNWWTNVLYINNLVKADRMCLGQSWYLANDMQFYCVLSPLVILLLYHVPVAGYVVAGVLVVAQGIANAALTVDKCISPHGVYAHMECGSMEGNFLTDFYVLPYTRWGPYVVGMMTGYFLHVTKCKLTIRWHVNAALWGAATACALAVLYGLYNATSGGSMAVGVAALYNALGRTVWAACVAWVIVACVTGHGGIVNTILSWPAFIPLSRLTYCIYLLHVVILDLYVLNSRMPVYLTDVNLVVLFLAALVVSCMAAVVATLAFESPMIGLEKVLLSTLRQRDDGQLEEKIKPCLHNHEP